MSKLEIKKHSFSTLCYFFNVLSHLEPLSPPLFSPSSRRRLNHLSLQPLLITSRRLIDGRQQLSRQVLMEKFLPMVREAWPNKNATMQNKWLFQVSGILVIFISFRRINWKTCWFKARFPSYVFMSQHCNINISNSNYYFFLVRWFSIIKRPGYTRFHFIASQMLILLIQKC